MTRANGIKSFRTCDVPIEVVFSGDWPACRNETVFFRTCQQATENATRQLLVACSMKVPLTLFPHHRGAPTSYALKLMIYTKSTFACLISVQSRSILFHRLNVIRHSKWSFCLAPDLVHSDSFGELDEVQSAGKVDIKHALRKVSQYRRSRS